MALILHPLCFLYNVLIVDSTGPRPGDHRNTLVRPPSNSLESVNENTAMTSNFESPLDCSEWEIISSD